MFYIFLAIAAIIPAMVLSMGGTDGGAPLYTNTWNIIAADTPLYVVRDIGDYANMNMVFIFGGIMVSILSYTIRAGAKRNISSYHRSRFMYCYFASLAPIS